MAKVSMKRAATGVRLRLARLKAKFSASSAPPPASSEFSSRKSFSKEAKNAGDAKEVAAAAASGPGRRIMVVVDSKLEAGTALQWALSHAVQSDDDAIVLLSVVKPCAQGELLSRSSMAAGAGHCQKEKNSRALEVLHAMRSVCQGRKPEIKVEVSLLADGRRRERGRVILEEARRQRVSLLVLGQKRKRSWAAWRLTTMVMRWWGRRWRRGSAGGNGGGGNGGGVVEYCIENAPCMSIAVRRKGGNRGRGGGGYLITTKRYKDFWLLA